MVIGTQHLLVENVNVWMDTINMMVNVFSVWSQVALFVHHKLHANNVHK